MYRAPRGAAPASFCALAWPTAVVLNVPRPCHGEGVRKRPNELAAPRYRMEASGWCQFTTVETDRASTRPGYAARTRAAIVAETNKTLVIDPRICGRPSRIWPAGASRHWRAGDDSQ